MKHDIQQSKLCVEIIVELEELEELEEGQVAPFAPFALEVSLDHMSKGNLSQLEANTEIPRLTKLVEPGCSMMEKTTCGGCSCTTPLDDTAHAASMMEKTTCGA